MAEVGYGFTTVEMIRAGAGISRRTFYDHFADRDAAVVAYFDRATEWLLGTIDSVAADPSVPRAGRIDAAVAAVLELVAAQPDAARAWLTPAGRSDERLADHRVEALAAIERRLAAQLRAERRRVPSAVGLELRVGGACEVVRTRLRARDPALDAVAPVLTFVLRQPAA